MYVYARRDWLSRNREIAVEQLKRRRNGETCWLRLGNSYMFLIWENQLFRSYKLKTISI